MSPNHELDSPDEAAGRQRRQLEQQAVRARLESSRGGLDFLRRIDDITFRPLRPTDEETDSGDRDSTR